MKVVKKASGQEIVLCFSFPDREVKQPTKKKNMHSNKKKTAQIIYGSSSTARKVFRGFRLRPGRENITSRGRSIKGKEKPEVQGLPLGRRCKALGMIRNRPSHAKPFVK